METIRIKPKEKGAAVLPVALTVLFSPSLEGTGGQRVVFNGALMVGRGPDGVDLALSDATVSRRHFRVSNQTAGLVLEDFGSANGTFVNGERVSGALLAAGDLIRVGNTLLLVGESQEAPDLPTGPLDGVVIRSPAMARVVAQLVAVSKSNKPVFLVGETGVGKDVLARLLHRASGRMGEFCPVNCAAMPDTLVESVLFGSTKGAYTGSTRSEPGWFKRADGGTLFLDELGEMPSHVQAKLNHVLETGTITPVGTTESLEVDVRVVAATNRVGILDGADCGFREDLLARIEDAIILVPPLRERLEEIPPLLDLVVRELGREQTGLGVGFVERALLYPWPRNVRQLLKTVAACLSRLPEGHMAEAEDFMVVAGGFGSSGESVSGGNSDSVSVGPPMPRVEDESENMDMGMSHAVIGRALMKNGGNVSAAARELGMTRPRFYRLMRRFGIEPGRGDAG